MNPFDLIKNAKEMQSQMKKMQDEIETYTAEGSSGGGIVKITLNGKFELLSVFLDPIAVDPRDITMLQDLIKAAHTDAVIKIRETLKQKAEEITGPMGDLSNILGNLS